MARRLIVIAGWFAAAILAVLVGLIGISVIGDGLTGGSATPMSEAEVERLLAAEPVPSTPSAPATSPSTASPSTASPSTASPSTASPSTASPSASAPPSRAANASTFPTRAGTVVGRCAGGGPEMVSMAPAQGYAMHERTVGVQARQAEGEFRSVSDNHDRVKIQVTCAGGQPAFQVRSERR